MVLLTKASAQQWAVSMGEFPFGAGTVFPGADIVPESQVVAVLG